MGICSLPTVFFKRLHVSKFREAQSKYELGMVFPNPILWLFYSLNASVLDRKNEEIKIFPSGSMLICLKGVWG